jgi:hypothetical protein
VTAGVAFGVVECWSTVLPGMMAAQLASRTLSWIPSSRELRTRISKWEKTSLSRQESEEI